MDGEELTEQETALYDRQIRVWGADAQRRLRKSHVLVYGMNGAVAENIVLAGVGSLMLVDGRVVNKEAFSANFLIPPDESVCTGKTLAEICCDSLKEFNPMVHVSVEKGDLASFDAVFFHKFDVVVVSCCSLANKKRFEEYVELDLQYPSFQEAITVPWRGLSRNVSKLYFAMRVIERFEEAEGRLPGQIAVNDLPAILKLKRDMCEAQSLDESHIPNALLRRLAVAGSSEFPPVCAVIGGVLGQEIIKAISGKGEPLKNFFFFDVKDGKGLIEDISTPYLES